MSEPTTVYVALLRGINVGGNTIIAMAALKTTFESLGYQAVKTYINSGNVIFRASQSNARNLEADIEAAIERDFGLHVMVTVRTQEEIRALLEHLPESWRTPAAERRNVIFLSHRAGSAEELAGLEPKPGIEELHRRPGVLLWSAQTSNLTKSNMLKLNRTPIFKEMTVRGLSTVLKIYELMQAA